MSKLLHSVTFIQPIPPYGREELVNGENASLGSLKLELLEAEEAQMKVPSIRVTPIGGGTVTRVCEMPYTAVLCISPIMAKQPGPSSIPIRRMSPAGQ